MPALPMSLCAMERTGARQAYVKASNTGANNFSAAQLPCPVTPWWLERPENQAAPAEVNGNQNNTSLMWAGAAYVYTSLGTGPSLNLSPDGTGGWFVRFNGVPDWSYQLQRSINPNGPWTNLAAPTAPVSGLIEYHDSAPPVGTALYRTIAP